MNIAILGSFEWWCISRLADEWYPMASELSLADYASFDDDEIWEEMNELRSGASECSWDSYAADPPRAGRGQQGF